MFGNNPTQPWRKTIGPLTPHAVVPLVVHKGSDRSPYNETPLLCISTQFSWYTLSLSTFVGLTDSAEC